MGHIQNVQSFEKLLGICTGYGGSYNPGKQNLRVENLSDLLKQAREKLLQVSVAKTNFENAQNMREAAFAEIRKQSSQVLAELMSSGVLPETVNDAALMVKKMRGYAAFNRAEESAAPQGSEISTEVKPRRRTNGSGYFSFAASFQKLIQTLESEPLYQPTIPELQVATLQEKLAYLQRLNSSVVKAAAEVGQARRERNTVLYGGRTSMFSTAMAVKHQVKAIFGSSSEATKAARKIRFSSIKI